MQLADWQGVKSWSCAFLGVCYPWHLFLSQRFYLRVCLSCSSPFSLISLTRDKTSYLWQCYSWKTNLEELAPQQAASPAGRLESHAVLYPAQGAAPEQRPQDAAAPAWQAQPTRFAAAARPPPLEPKTQIRSFWDQIFCFRPAENPLLDLAMNLFPEVNVFRH